MLFLKLADVVIAFSDPDVYNLARYAITFPHNVFNRPGGGYTIFNHRNAILTDVQKRGVREYMIGWLPSLDAASLFKVCKILREGYNGP